VNGLLQEALRREAVPVDTRPSVFQ
jgi:hypothetical protein